MKHSDAQFPIRGEVSGALDAAKKALAAEGYTWKPTGDLSGIAGRGDPDKVGEQPKGSAHTQIEVRIEGSVLITKRLSKGNHMGPFGIVEVQRRHRKAARAVEAALSEAGHLA